MDEHGLPPDASRNEPLLKEPVPELDRDGQTASADQNPSGSGKPASAAGTSASTGGVPDAQNAQNALDERMMRAALLEAEIAASLGEAPIGAVVARGDEILARAHNERETGRDATLHAECTAIRRACEALGGWRLPGCTLYVTLEPCPMCAGAAINARIERVVYGARDPKAGSVDSLVRLFELGYNHRPALRGGVLESECAGQMTRFFLTLRGKRSVRRMKKIDMHAHCTMNDTVTRQIGGRFASPDVLRGAYDRMGVDRGVALALASPEWSMDPITSYDCERVCRERPDVIGWWFCFLDPRAVWYCPGHELDGYLAQYKARGARGVGEMTSGLWFDDPLCLNLFGAVERAGLPLTFHIGVGEGEYGLRDEPGLPRLERVLGMFPRLTFLGHSQRFWSELSGDVRDDERGGYPTGPVAPGGRVPELMRRYPNLHADLSAGSGHNAITRDPDFGYAFLEEFSDRLYYAVDICDPSNLDRPMCRLSAYLDDAVLQNRISDRAYRAICRDNALRLLEGRESEPKTNV